MREVLEGDIKENITALLSKERLRVIIDPDRKKVRLFTQLCERAFLDFRDWLNQNRSELAFPDRARYCRAVIGCAINTPAERGDFVNYANNQSEFANNEEVAELKQNQPLQNIARDVRQAFFEYLPVTRDHDDIYVVDLKGGFSSGIFYSVNNLAKEVTQSGFRRHLEDGAPSEQMSHAQRVLQERENQPPATAISTPRKTGTFAERIAQENQQTNRDGTEESKTSDTDQCLVSKPAAGRQ